MYATADQLTMLPSQKEKVLILKDSPPEILAAADVPPKGRTYATEISKQPGAITAKDLVLGTKLACIAITDDKEGTLKNVGKTNPWQIQALTIITGSEEEAHKPLTHILNEHFHLTCDTIIDVRGLKGGHFHDTQGYIAHNDEIIVLSYRCTTSGFDWLTNLSTSSSAWEPNEDIGQGHSGNCSCLDFLWSDCSGELKPRVHTGFYSNFICSAPMIKQYIEPLLAPDQPPRKLYVVGHSLGAGVATLAACYFLTEFNWAELPHKFVNVTAGSPRAVQVRMQERIQEIMKELRPLDKAVVARIVRDKDTVATVPPAILGFRHLDKLIYITRDGRIIVNPNLGSVEVVDKEVMEDLLLKNSSFEQCDANEDSITKKTKYDKMIAKIPGPFRDHMPEFYLEPLMKLMEREITGEGVGSVVAGGDAGDSASWLIPKLSSLSSHVPNRVLVHKRMVGGKLQSTTVKLLPQISSLFRTKNVH